MKGDSKLFP